MQVVDANGNVFGAGLEVTGSDGKPKVPIINTDITIGTTVITGGVSGRVLYDNAGVVGELDLSAIYVPTSRTITINGTTQDLSANRSWTISTGITIGTTAITSGTVGRVLFEGTGNVVQESANLFWDNTNGRLGVGTSSTSGRLSVLGTSTTVPNNATWISAGNPIASLFGEGIGGNMDLFIGGASSVSSARPVLTGRKSAGTLASPTALSNGDNIFSFLSGGYSGTSFVNTGSINMIVDGVVSSGTVPQAITFETGTSSRAERLRIGSNGNVLINTTTDAGFKLDVNGTARVVGQATIQTLTIGLGGGAIASNTAIGLQALNGNTTGVRNVALGQQSNFTNSTGADNTAIGHSALFSNTANHNTAVGSQALYTNTGNHNSAFGRNAMISNTSGSQNTGIGRDALSANTTGSDNSALGYQTASGNFSGSTILGRGATATANNQFVVGSTGTVAGAVTSEVNASTQVWNVVINGVARKILLA